MISLKKVAPLVIILFFSLVAWFMGLNQFISIDSLRIHQAELQNLIEHHFILFVLAFSSLYIIAVGLSIPIATALTLAGGFFLGQSMGTLIVVLSATLGACLVFASAKLASEDILREKAGPWLKKMQAGFRENAFSYLLTLRLIPLFPFVAINFAAAIFQISFQTFFWGTLIGIIPGSWIYVSIGVALREVISSPDFSLSLVIEPKILGALIGLGLLSLLQVVYKYFHAKSKKAR